jgi:hypothetical protein
MAITRRALIGALGFPIVASLATSAGGREVGGPVAMYYGPDEDFMRVDRELLRTVPAGQEVIAAFYVLSNFRVIGALEAVARRGSRIRLYLDPSELQRQSLSEGHPVVKLLRTPGVEARTKAQGAGLMHLKCYDYSGPDGICESEPGRSNSAGQRHCRCERRRLLRGMALEVRDAVVEV